MGTRIKHSFINKFLLFICIFFFSALNAFASNALSGVDVKQIDDGSYNVILKIDNSVNIKKNTDTKDNLSLILDSAVPADSVEIVYDNTSDIKNVMVQKKNSDNTMILIQGKNIENAKIFTKDISTGIVNPLDNKLNSLNNYLYIANVKYLSFCFIGIIFMFVLMISLRPKRTKYSYNVKKQYKTIKQTTINNMNKKTNSSKRYVPSINYRINNVRYNNMSVPKDFEVNTEVFEEEKIRKAG